MSTNHDNNLSFVSNLLKRNPINNDSVKSMDKSNNAILSIKKKALNYDCLIQKCYDRKEKLIQTEKYLWISKDECKQVCINYSNTLEKYNKLDKAFQPTSIHFSSETCGTRQSGFTISKNQCFTAFMDVQHLHMIIKELQERSNFSENQCKAIQSHANQLQVLVRDYETEIQSLKIENQLQRSNTKECTKQTSKKNENDVLIKDLCMLRDIVLGKKKLRSHHKIVLKKYDSFKANTDNDSDSECSIDDMDVFEHSISSPLPILTKSMKDQVLKSFPANELEKNINNDESSIKTLDIDHDSDSGNEVISEDTGRGSSLACFDIEKCFNSPDYYINNSPSSNGVLKEKKKYTDTSTSPITVQRETSDAATSPVPFSNRINNLGIVKMQKPTKDIGITVNPSDFITTRDVATSPIKIKLRERATSPIKKKHQDMATSPIRKKHQEMSTSPMKKNQKDRATSPTWKHVLKEKATSPIKKILNEKETSPVEFNKLTCNIVIDTNEKECSEINSSDGLNDNHNSDCEVENILSLMRFDRELITPIPKSPAKSHNRDDIQSSRGSACQDPPINGEEIKILQTNVADLTKELLNLKNMFKNHLSTNDHQIHPTTRDCNESDVILNAHKKVLVNKSPQINVAEKINICNSRKTPEYEKHLEIDDKSQNKEQNDNKNLLREEIIIEDYSLKSPIKVVGKVKKTTKVTRLEKLRKKLLPKCKIRTALTPSIPKVRHKKQLLFKKNITETPSVAEINNKLAFENAVKVMAELKSKEKNKVINSTENKNLDRSKHLTQEVYVVLSECDRICEIDKNITNTSKLDMLKSPVTRKTSTDGALDDQNISSVNTTSSTNLDVSPNGLTSPSSITTRSRSKRLSSLISNSSDTSNISITSAFLPQEQTSSIIEVEARRRLKRTASDKIEVAPKRKLRSSDILSTLNISEQAMKTHNVKEDEISPNSITKSVEVSSNNISKPLQIRRRSARLSALHKNEPPINKDAESLKTAKVVLYNDLDIFTKIKPNIQKHRTSTLEKVPHPKESILCKMIERHAKHSVRCIVKKISDTTINAMCQKLEDGIEHILSVPQNKSKEAMNNFVRDIRNCNMRNFLAGFMKYMKDPARKNELYNKISAPPAPHMTKSEQVLLYILKELQSAWPSINFVEIVLSSIEFALFQLNHTPEFGTVESLSHFYAVLCRYFKAKSRLRLFIFDAMYCIQFKSVAVIKQCLDVWMHILPLAHMGIAKTPLVTCLVYLLHFFKCEDKFNRVQEIRDILSRRYFYKVSEWTESNVLEMFKNAIKEFRDIPIEKKMLRMSLIILAKRRGPQWCQKHIVKNMLQPLIEKDNVPERIKEFCVSILGALLKPYPNDMKIYCEIVVNQLLEMLDRDVSPRMKEAIFSSLLFMRRHNPTRVTQALLTWKPDKISSDLEQLLKDYVREKPAKAWKTTLSKISLV